MLFQKISYVIVLVGMPMVVGFLTRQWLLRRGSRIEAACSRWSRRMKLVCFGVLTPPTVISAMVRYPVTGSSAAAMATLGVMTLMTGALIGRMYLAARPMPRQQAGAFISCVSMSNLVSFGGLVTFAFWGNEGLQQLFLFKLFEHVVYFGVFYPWCASYSDQATGQRGGLISLFRRYPVTMVPIGSVVVGLIWNVLLYQGTHPATGPPDWSQQLNRFLVPAGVMLLTFAVGLTLSPTRLGRYGSACASVSVILFICRPVLTAAAAYGCLWTGLISDLGFRVAVVLAAMPVAFNALIPPSLYGLDEDLANSCWIVTTVAMAVVVPVLYVLMV